MTNCAEYVAPLVVTVQRCASASQVASSTTVSNTNRSRTPEPRATFWM